MHTFVPPALGWALFHQITAGLTASITVPDCIRLLKVCGCVCVCVGGGNPCSEGLLSHVQFLVSVPNLQAGAHGILDPPCATKLRSWMGYQGWSPWCTCSWSRCSFIIQAFWWLSGYSFVICMNNSRNRSPLRIFQYLPISATFVQCGQRRPSWTKHVNSRISSGTL